jgi:predicted Zn-ribbon and HTH transcriptional regulator
MESTFFEIEKQVETFQSQLQTLVLESVLKEAASVFSQCPKCRSSNVVIYESDHGGERRDHWSMKTSLGSSLLLRPNMLPKGKCNDCGRKFDIAKDCLKLSEKNKFSPLTQMKICSANRAGSYENAVILI